ncbi:snRNA-activating protein complex subunit 1 [Pseudophryne corroboree]|uniref:snRNA-activating protein complex subunit 1 n=1 Tax=Pseudophryne corroboree TaxID=495146 RepID=UPI003081EFAC
MSFPGLKEDCETFLGRFQAADSVRYEDFMTVWKDLKFFTIFHGGMRNLESNRFTKEAFSVVSAYFLPPYTFQIRVGALYLMYGLYNTQLCQPKQKIRIALKDWSEIEKFHEDLISAQHLDAVYVFRHMRRSRAFYFTAMPMLLTFRSQRTIPTDGGKEEFKDKRDRVADLVTTETVEEIMNIHEHYQKTKCLISSDKSQPDKSLSLIKEEFAGNLQSIVEEHQRWKQEKRTPRTKNEDDKEETSQESEGSGRAKMLAQIKSKCYTSATQSIKSRRHRQVQLVSSESGSDHGSAKARRQRLGRARRKAAREAQKKRGRAAVTQKKSVNMPAIPEEDSSSSSEDLPLPKRKR